MTIDVARIREHEFPWAARGEYTFLDHASTGPLPARTRRVIDTQNLKRAEPFRLAADDFFPVLQRARERAAALIGAPRGSVALVTNTSHGVNIAARTRRGAGATSCCPPLASSRRTCIRGWQRRVSEAVSSGCCRW